jgi:protein gp37
MESQREHNRRMKHLKQVVAAVRWVSAEPLLDSTIRFDLSKVNWVVVGGESGGNGRKMEKEWVLDIYRQCKKASVPFFFKQWGDFGEDGKPAKRHSGKGHDTLDGKIIHEYPVS